MSKYSPVRLPVTIALLALFSASTVGAECTPADPDLDTRGRMEAPDGTPLCPIVLPWEVCVDELDAADLSIPASRMMAWWQEQACRDGIPRDWFVPLDPAATCAESTLGVMYIHTGVPETPGAFAEASFTTNGYEEIPFCNVVVAFDWLWVGDDTLTLWLEHEAGHCMGLRHDREETGSIMVTPTPEGAVLTNFDFDILVAGCE